MKGRDEVIESTLRTALHDAADQLDVRPSTSTGAAWNLETITQTLAADSEVATMTAPRALTSTRPRRRRPLALAAAAAVLAAVVVGAVLLSDDAPSRSKIVTAGLPTTAPPAVATAAVPDVAKTHAIVVTPSTGLRDRQIVRVSGEFTPPGSVETYVSVQICRAGVTPSTASSDCDGAGTGQSTAVGAGATVPFRHYPYMVRRTITVGGQPVDCAAAPGCVLYAAGGRSREAWGVAPPAFDPVAPSLPGPTVTVTPHGALRDGDVVTVRVRHFRPFSGMWVTVCVSGTEVCDGIGINNDDFTVDANGSFAGLAEPWSVFSSSVDETPQNCHVVPCVVRVNFSELGDVPFDVPISFAPAGNVSYPKLTLDPAGPYTDGQRVTATVQGWPGPIGQRPAIRTGNLALGFCVRLQGFSTLVGDPTECPGNTPLRGPNADGHYTATLTVHRTMEMPPGIGHFDCTQPGTCQVALALPGTGPSPGSYYVVIVGTDIVVD